MLVAWGVCGCVVTRWCPPPGAPHPAGARDPRVGPPPAPGARRRTDTTCDLLVVGGGYSGLWTALLAKERDPGRDV
ncbi:hypothetical protein ACWGRA_30320, partial [Streptomyces albidoflavus]